MDALLKHAGILIDFDNKYRYLPIKNRLTFISDQQANAEARSLKINDLEVLGWRISVSDHSVQKFEQTVVGLQEKLKIFRPGAVFVSNEPLVGVASVIAAKRLGIPFFYQGQSDKEDSSSYNDNLELFLKQHADQFYAANEDITAALKRDISQFNFSPINLPQRPGNKADLNLTSATFQNATHLFFREGNIQESCQILEYLTKRGIRFDRRQQEFQALVKGLQRLQQGIEIPPRQPNPGLKTRSKQLLYCLHQSVPHMTNGYSTRSHGIAVGLKTAGWHVSATTRSGFPWDQNIKIAGKGRYSEKVDGVTYTAGAGWSINKTPLDRYIAEAADHFLREAQACGAEVIVAASNHTTALPALIAARRLGLPFVYEVRGLWEVTQASTQPEWMDSDRYYLMKMLEAQTAKEADLVVTLTPELADELVARGTDREHIHVVPNAVDENLFQPKSANTERLQQLNIKPDIPVIGYAGSAVAYEGLDLLMQALAKLKQAQVDFYFVLVGDGNVMDTVKAKAQQLGISNQCRFTGRVPFSEVPEYLACMDIMPVPRLSSAVTEMVSPLKPLEAMAMGKAVLLSDVSPHQLMAGNGERARLFNKDSVESLAENLAALINNPQERERLGKAARQWIEQERTWKKVTRHYSDLIDAQLKQSKADAQLITQQAKDLGQITIGLIADQFTTDTLASAVNVVPLSPDNWQQQIDSQHLDAVFVESAWKGNDWQWHKKVGYYSEDEFAPLKALLSYCRKQAIPSLFWNKEDPVHFERFRKAAALCDHVFTTDSRRIIPYLTTPDLKTKTVSSCPFYASPKLHNLLPSTRQWQHTAAYGGTYYGERYPERTEFMDKIMSAAAPLGLTIYDRQHDDPESPYKYPGPLGSYVAGSLDYEQMIQAYKAHPVQINVNSVLDSPTMFSRRVVETAACGSPLVSGPALGMNNYLDGAAYIAQTESDAAEALENLLLNPAYRWRIALKGARAIMRAHTTEQRLAQMLRTAGMVINAPQPTAFSLVTTQVSELAAKQIVNQTVRPHSVIAEQWSGNAKQRLQQADILCADAAPEKLSEGSWWLFAEASQLEKLEPEDCEDLIWPTFYAPHQRIGFIRLASLTDAEWPGVAVETATIDTRLQLVKAKQQQTVSELKNNAGKLPTLALRKPAAIYQRKPLPKTDSTVVIAGHDLKFIKPFYPNFLKAGKRVLLDFWTGHNNHSKKVSERLLKQADTIFCEWMLGNAMWYGKHKQPGQKLVGRLHAQELRSKLFDNVPFEQFDSVIFVGPHMLRNAQERNKALHKNGKIIYNGVDVEQLQAVPRQTTNGKVLGLVGMVPQSKRLDRALDILKQLRQQDSEYTLRIKGKRPEDYPWMAQRKEEMAWYQKQYARIETDPDLKGAVQFDPHGNDMANWYAGVDYILSVSDHESFHLAVAEGAAAGCVPIVLPWQGADEIYPAQWVHQDIDKAVRAIKNKDINTDAYKKYVAQHFNRALVAQSLTDAL